MFIPSEGWNDHFHPPIFIPVECGRRRRKTWIKALLSHWNMACHPLAAAVVASIAWLYGRRMKSGTVGNCFCASSDIRNTTDANMG